MRVIQSNEVRMTPMHCAVVGPTLGQTSGHRFIDTGYDMNCKSVNTPNRIYVSEPAVGEMAKKFGWTPPAEVEEMRRHVALLEDRLGEVSERAAELEARFQSIDVLASAGFVARKKPGKPAAKVVA